METLKLHICDCGHQWPATTATTGNATISCPVCGKPLDPIDPGETKQDPSREKTVPPEESNDQVTFDHSSTSDLSSAASNDTIASDYNAEESTLVADISPATPGDEATAGFPPSSHDPEDPHVAQTIDLPTHSSTSASSATGNNVTDQTLDLQTSATAGQGAAAATDGPAASVSELPTRHRGSHSITRFLAEGGLGKIFVAQDKRLEREVVMKTIRFTAKRESEAIVRFEREARINAQLEHPNIVPIYQAGTNEEDGQPYYTMKFIRGCEFKELIDDYHNNSADSDDDRTMELRRLLTLFVNACHAISYAHDRGVVHRDIKPENIAVGEFEELLVLDWGIAKVLNEPESGDQRQVMLGPNDSLEKTQQGRIAGTPAYMAPEQAAGQNDRVGPAADVYALGGVLFRILTGKTPHRRLQEHSQAEVSRWTKRKQTDRTSMLSDSITRDNSTENTIDLLMRIQDGVIAAPRDINPNAPAALAAVCQKAMELDPAQRYRNTAQLAQEINCWLADEPVAAFPDPWSTRVRRWMRRHQTLVVGTAATVAATVIGLIAIVFVVTNANAQLDNKNHQLDRLNSSLKKSNNAERAARQQALRHLKDARISADAWLLDLSGDLQNYPGLETARQRLLKKATTYYESFTSKPTSDPQLRIEYARCQMRLGDVWRLLGDAQKSKDAYTQAANSLSGIQAPPAEPGALAVLRANSHTGLGLVYSDQPATHDHALGEFEQAIQLLSPLEKLGTAGRNALATAHWGAAKIYDTQGDLEKAKQFLSKATAEFQKLTGEEDSPRFIARRLNTLNDLGSVLEKQGQLAESAAVQNEAVQFYSQLMTAQPSRADYFDERDQKMAQLEIALRQMGRAETALVVDNALVQDYSARFQETLLKTLGYLENRALTHAARWQLLVTLQKDSESQQALQLAIEDYHALLAAAPSTELFAEHRSRYQTALSELQKSAGDKPADPQ